MEGLLSTEDRIDYLQGTVTAQRAAGDAMRKQMDAQRLRIEALEARLAAAAQMDADLRSGLMQIARRNSDLNRPDVCQAVAEVLGMDTQELHRAMAK